MPQLCGTVTKETFDLFTKRAKENETNTSLEVAKVLNREAAKETPKNAKQKVSTKKK